MTDVLRGISAASRETGCSVVLKGDVVLTNLGWPGATQSGFEECCAHV